MYAIILLLAVFGAIGLIQGEYRLSGYRKVRAPAGRIVGLILLVGAALTYYYSSNAVGLVALIIGGAIALTNLQEIHYPPPDDLSPPPG